MTQRLRRLIAAVEIGGGFAGMALTSLLTMEQGLTLHHRALLGLLGLPFALCAYAGRELWRDEQRGYVLSLFVQAAQVPAWSSPHAFFLFYCGGQLGAWFGKEDLSPMMGIGSHLTVGWAAEPRATVFGLNFLALWAFWRLLLGWGESRAAKTMSSVSAPA